MWFSVVCALIDNIVVKMLWTRVRPQQILTIVMTNIVVNKSTDNAKPQSICFLTPYQQKRKCLRAEKGIA